jgi:hypothetical protein
MQRTHRACLTTSSLCATVPRKALAENFNTRGYYNGKEYNIIGYQLAHASGPGFGLASECADGIMLAPEPVNWILQNDGVERVIRSLHNQVHAQGFDVQVAITAVSHPVGVPGAPVPKATAGDTRLLERITYEVWLQPRVNTAAFMHNPARIPLFTHEIQVPAPKLAPNGTLIVADVSGTPAGAAPDYRHWTTTTWHEPHGRDPDSTRKLINDCLRADGYPRPRGWGVPTSEGQL